MSLYRDVVLSLKSRTRNWKFEFGFVWFLRSKVGISLLWSSCRKVWNAILYQNWIPILSLPIIVQRCQHDNSYLSVCNFEKFFQIAPTYIFLWYVFYCIRSFYSPVKEWIRHLGNEQKLLFMRSKKTNPIKRKWGGCGRSYKTFFVYRRWKVCFTMKSF